MNVAYSLITIEYNRRDNLINLLTGLSQGSEYPDEVIIISMSSENLEIDNIYPFKINYHQLDCNIKDGIPLAKARNYGASMAFFNNLIFLDVDCIPDIDFIRILKKQSALREGIIMGTPRYLTDSIPRDFSEKDLAEKSVPHPHRPITKKLSQEFCYELFWSLCFYISKKQFEILDRFDEGYQGYGAEDTDFSFKAKEANCPFFLSEATVFHQQHAFCKPPLDQFENIVKNCEYFYSKWGIWPMDNHLKGFSEMDLIDWNPDDKKPIAIKGFPSQKEIDASKVLNAPFA